ncbi:glycosyltransferase family 2 protein [Leifsonia poae]|uniref:Uncharacterized protein n=1 Tax=Leifsonia poae TaxID=110933 RepID=A0A9W6H7V7_9MICO|nr:hypothetical protein [Leifsonia poae]GLJ75560.1 hypothetical protein GCM10017584_11340 [Leifsonia poae]
MTLTVVLRLTDGDDDIVAASVLHYRSEGVDRVIIVDGSASAAVSTAFEAVDPDDRAGAVLTRSWDPEGDGWRLDAQGGEFWVATTTGVRLVDAFERIERGIGRIDVPVVPMTGQRALSGPGFARLTFRDLRPGAAIAGGRPATRTALRAGDESPAEAPGIEVLRLADRSVEQVRARDGLSDTVGVARYLAEPGTDDVIAAAVTAGSLRAENRLAPLAAAGIADVALTADAEAVALRAGLAGALDRIDVLEPVAAQASAAEAELRRLAGRRAVRVADSTVRIAGATIGRARRAAASGRRTLAERRRARADQRRASAVQRLLTQPLRPAVVVGAPAADAVPVIMCLWNRPARFDAIVRMIAGQQLDRPLRLILWNNGPAHQAEYERRLAALAESFEGTAHAVELIRSPANIGGVARFVVARRLWLDGLRGPFIMLDDDQLVGPDFAATMLAEYEPRTIAAWWAFGNHGSHWKRSELEPGEPADYAGTGGAIVDLDLVADPSFFELPPRFLMLEDQWMTFVAVSRGWRVRKSAVAIDQVMQEESGNQYHALRALKDEFYAYLYADR